MKFIMTARPGENSTVPDPNGPLDEKLFSDYMAYNEALHKAGVLVAAEGLNPAGKGARVEARNGKRTVVDGPFTESKELVGGFYILDVPSLEAAIEWALKAPSGLGIDDVLEIRQLTGEEDLPPELIELVKRAAPTWSATLVKESESQESGIRWVARIRHEG